MAAKEISSYFNASSSTVSQKAKLIMDMFGLDYWNAEFSTKRMQENNPFTKILKMNGLIIL